MFLEGSECPRYANRPQTAVVLLEGFVCTVSKSLSA